MAPAPPSASASSASSPFDWSSLWSAELKRMRPSSIAGIVNQFAGLSGLVTMHVGLPSADSFPLSSITASRAHADSDEDMVMIKTHSKISTAQQYIFSRGYTPLLNWAKSLVTNCHTPPYPIECCMTAGSTQGVASVIHCITDRGDFLIAEEFTFSAFIETIFIPRDLKVLPIKMDQYGMLPDHLEATLQKANEAARMAGIKPPRVMFTVPSGQNPTGAVMTLERKQAVYKIAQKYNLVIVEDDAYWWLQYGDQEAEPDEMAHTNGRAKVTTNTPGLRLPPSFLSLDVDGRVVRVDTISKLLGPGYRIGWVSGKPAIIEKVAAWVQGSTTGPCSLSMVLINEMVSGWGPERFEGFVKQQQAMYRRRAKVAVEGATDYLTGLADWSMPAAGMFMWVKLTALDDVSPELITQLVQQRVVIMPGRLFWSDLQASERGDKCPYLRITFGGLSEDLIIEGFRRLGVGIRNLLESMVEDEEPTANGAEAAADDAADQQRQQQQQQQQQLQQLQQPHQLAEAVKSLSMNRNGNGKPDLCEGCGDVAGLPGVNGASLGTEGQPQETVEASGHQKGGRTGAVMNGVHKAASVKTVEVRGGERAAVGMVVGGDGRPHLEASAALNGNVH